MTGEKVVEAREAPLRAARDAFARGDYRALRALTESYVRDSKEVSAEADEMRALHRATRVDRLEIGILMACLALFLVVTYAYVL